MILTLKNIEWGFEMDESLIEKLPTTIDVSDEFTSVMENKLFRMIDDSINEKVQKVLKEKGYDFDEWDIVLEDWDYELKW
jgi:hypothetical protein